MPPAAWKLWVLVITFCSAMAPELSPADTMVSPATAGGGDGGRGKADARGIVGDGGGHGESRSPGWRWALAPRPNSWLKLMPVVPRWVVSPVTFSA